MQVTGIATNSSQMLGTNVADIIRVFHVDDWNRGDVLPIYKLGIVIIAVGPFPAVDLARLQEQNDNESLEYWIN